MKQDDDKWYAIGIANSNWVFDDKMDYTIYTRVSSFIDWIVDTIQNN
jgi:hypothetical protein